MLVLQTRPSRLLGGGFSRVLRNSITIKMVLGIVLFFAGMSSLYVNHRLGLSLAGVGLVLVFVPAEFLFGLCIDFKGHKENARCSRSGSTKSDNQQPTEVVVEDDGLSASGGDNASTFPPEVVLQEAGSGDAAAGGSLQDGGSGSPGSDSRRTSSPRCTCQAGRNSPPDTSAQLHRTRSDVLRTGPGSAGDVRSDASPPADDARKEATPSPTCKFHRTRSAVLRAEDLPKNAPPQVVRFNIGADADDPAAAAASGVAARTLSGGSRVRAAAGPSSGARAALVRGVSFEQTTFHRSKSAVMHRGSLSGDEATTSSPSSSAKSSPTRSLRGQANSSPYKERPLAPAVARVQQLQQIPAMRIQSSKGGAVAGDWQAEQRQERVPWPGREDKFFVERRQSKTRGGSDDAEAPKDVVGTFQETGPDVEGSRRWWPAPWTSLAVQTAAGVITLLCKPQQQGAESASLLPPKQAKAGVRETSGVVPRIVTVSVSGDEDSSADREDSASPSKQRDSSSSLAQTSS
ncbi:hypothetical protein MTO96_027785 [Rhipicephalus appendiculatus]